MSKKIVIGVFTDESQVVSAIKKLKENKIRINDVYGPFASHDILTAISKPSRLPHLAFLFGAGTVVLTLAFLYYTAVIDYPLSYGGKPVFAFPAKVVVIYLATILFTATLSVFAFLGRSAMFPGKKPRIPGEGAMDDRFFIVISQDGDVAETATNVMKESGAVEIRNE